ncbi:MAG: DUF4404 family protein [Pirellulaceae bacterium]|nr:DUF4404 family protein [Pirellulaceae bacterium]
MEKKRLQGTLEELHESLQETHEIDEQTRRLLKDLTNDIQRLLEQEDQPSSDDLNSVSDDLKELLLKFQTEHPQLNGVLRRIADGLANLGI